MKEVQSKLREQHRHNVNAAASAFLIFIFLLFFTCAFADLGGAFDKHITQELSAGVYEDGVLTEETTIHIDGIMDYLYFDDDGQNTYQHFSGKVSIGCLPETEDMEAWISWERDGYVKFSLDDGENSALGTSGTLPRSGYAYIDRSFFYMAFELSDGRIVSTGEKYVSLLALEDYYPLSLEYESVAPRTLLEWILNER